MGAAALSSPCAAAGHGAASSAAAPRHAVRPRARAPPAGLSSVGIGAIDSSTRARNPRVFGHILPAHPMATRPPHGNLTAALVAVASAELVVNRLLGHLFTTPSCHSVLGCVALRMGPFLLYLTGVLAVIVIGGGVAGHLVRGELFPRGMRITIGALSTVFLALLAASLVAGQAPARYETHILTSFGFVAAMVALAFLVSPSAGARGRIGLVLFALPPLLHVTSFIASRALWWHAGWPSADALAVAGEVALLFAALGAPFFLLPTPVSWSRLAPALAMAAGVGTSSSWPRRGAPT